MSIPMITVNYFDPRINKVLGTVYTHHSEAISLGRDIFASVRGIIGGPSPLFLKKINDALKGAIENFKEEISNKYPNAKSVVGLKIGLLEINTETNQRTDDVSGWISFISNFFGGGDEQVPQNHIEAPELTIPQYMPQEGGGGSYIVATIIGNVIGPI